MSNAQPKTCNNEKCQNYLHLTYFTICTAGWGLELQENGEYTGIVIQVEEEAPELSCRTLLHNLQVTASKHVTWQY